MREMRPTIHTMLRRYQNWDYRSRAIYMITLSLANRRSNALGELVIDSPPGTPPREVKAHVALSKLGEGVLELWKRQSAFVPQIKPLFGMVMPDHFHGILQVTEPMTKPLGIVIGAFKGGCTRLWRELLPAARNGHAHVAASGPSCSVSGATASGLFSDGFNDKILFRAGELGAWFNYLADNPRRLAIKRRHPQLFTVVNALTIDLGFKARFSALGNPCLLDAPAFWQVQCSRALFKYRRVEGKIKRDEPPEITSEAFEELKADALLAARHGAVLVSPCLSDGEREIARAAYDGNVPLVVIKNKGFAPLDKPSGRPFDTCAAGRLLMLAPANWPYTPGQKPMTRLDACTMNRIAQLIAKSGAADINYRGIKPADVNRLVQEACMVQPVAGEGRAA